MAKFVAFKFKPLRIGEYKVLDVDYHRNGVSGEGFYTGIFKQMAGGLRGKTFIFTMFSSFSGWEDGQEYVKAKDYTFDNACGDYRCAVLCLDDVNETTSVQDAWRGDYYYHAVVQEAIKEHQRQVDAHYKLDK